MAKYENAPLSYVIFVADLNPASILGESSALDQIHEELEDLVPVREDMSGALIGPDGMVGPAGGARFVDRDQHLAVVVAPSRIAVDTTQYTTFVDFAEMLDRVLTAVASVAPRRACRRLGLRYVDEIRVPEVKAGSVADWQGWIDDSLLPGVALRPGSSSRTIAGSIDESYEAGYAVRFAWHTGDGYAVNPDGPLRVPDPSPPGPYFALDTDSQWSAEPQLELLLLGDAELHQRIRRLHEPVHSFFEMSLTKRLRTEILKPIQS